MQRPDVGIVIPAFNEEATLAKVINAIKPEGHVIVVDDGSSDDTSTIAANCGATVVTHRINAGYDGALNSGFKKASELGLKYVITIDADGQHDTTLVRRYIDELKDNDLVLGVRDRQQRFGEYAFSFVTTILYGVKDPFCGMKGYAMSLYHQLGHFDAYGSIGTELALYALKRRCRFTQVPVLTRPRQGIPRFGRSFKANYKLLRALVLSFFKV